MILVWLQIILAVATIVLVFFQPPSDDRANYQSFFSPQTTKRGWEKITFFLTLIVIFGFLFVSFLRLVTEKVSL